MSGRFTTVNCFVVYFQYGAAAWLCYFQIGTRTRIMFLYVTVVVSGDVSCRREELDSKVRL